LKKKKRKLKAVAKHLNISMLLIYMTTQNQTVVEKEIEAEILNEWLEVAKNNVVIWRIIDGVVDMLMIDKNELIKYMHKFLSDSLLQDARRDIALEDAIMRIAETLMDYEMWDAYHESRAPSAYRYATAVAAWLYLFATSYGGDIPLGCPLFDRRVVASITEFLATRTAHTIHEALQEALVDATWRLVRSLPRERREVILKMPRERRVEEALLRFCSPQ